MEINKDLDILKDIISNVLLKAIMIEKPFRESLNNQVEAIRLDIDSKPSKLDKFMDINIKILDKENYNKINMDPELNIKLISILEQVEKA